MRAQHAQDPSGTRNCFYLITFSFIEALKKTFGYRERGLETVGAVECFFLTTSCFLATPKPVSKFDAVIIVDLEAFASALDDTF